MRHPARLTIRPAAGRIAILILLAGCDMRPSGAPLRIDMLADTTADMPAPATGTGLVRFDEEGQIVAGVALRWAVFDGGRDAIFRIDPAAGADAPAVARRLTTVIRHGEGPLVAALAGETKVVAVTGTVVAVTLAQAQPDLLTILADPAFARLAPDRGPTRIGRRTATGVALAGRSPDIPAPALVIRRERVGTAILRFAAGQSDAMLGGRFQDLPVARAGAIAPDAIRFDPAIGLLGLAETTHGGGAYADPALRHALDLAIDRDRIVTAIGAPGNRAMTTITGDPVAAAPADRRAAARAIVAARAVALPVLTVAMPSGAGATLMFRLLQDDWRRIGIEARRLPLAAASADLRLIDVVAPASALGRIACVTATGCDPRDAQALAAPPFIPLTRPVRWSLVAPEIRGFVENAVSAHPLDRLHRR